MSNHISTVYLNLHKSLFIHLFVCLQFNLFV